MLDALPANALLTADAAGQRVRRSTAIPKSGWHSIRHHERVVVTVGLSRRSRPGYPGLEASRQQPLLNARLVVARAGRQPVYLVTSVRDESILSDEQVVRIYSLRWGVELFYRHFKQTFERRKLRSHTADNAELEATWSLLGLWAMGLHAQVELGQEVPASRISVAKLLRAYRTSLREYKSLPDPGESLWDLLSKAVIDAYQRANKSSRDYPRKKQHPATGAPKIRCATKAQINAARDIRVQHELRLTA